MKVGEDEDFVLWDVEGEVDDLDFIGYGYHFLFFVFDVLLSAHKPPFQLFYCICLYLSHSFSCYT